MIAWFASWLSNPLMLGVGAAAVLSPILIHLLNKRKFRVVNWAAMDFLFDADKKNRRRVRLENFILLLLRCLGMLLLGLLLAKPFLSSGTFGRAQDFQRVVVLDDSMSQKVRVGSESAFSQAKDKLKQLVQKFATGQYNDYLTLYLTSNAEKPVAGLTNEPITADSLGSIIARIDELECTDQVADYQPVLDKVNRFVTSDRNASNRAVYVLTDMRRRDWIDSASADSETSPARLVGTISENASSTYVVDVGSSLEENLAITDIRADDILVAGTIVRFSVAVTNFGRSTAENVGLRFRVGDFQPQTETVGSIPAGKTETATFRYLFEHDRQDFGDLEFQDKLLDISVNSRIQVEVIQEAAIRDSLTEDSSAYFAARTLKAIPVLIVDGDPSSIAERSESHSLAQLGDTDTGILVDVATVGELETKSLSKYRVIFLLNVDEASKDRITALEKWVEDGGGLVFMPGNRVRASTFNESFYRDGQGLSPMKLEATEGDPGRTSWAYLEVREPRHPALKVALDEDIGFENSEIFAWWRGSVAPDQDGVSVSVPMVIGNKDKTPAIVDRVLGKGRTVTFAIPADADWTVWPGHPTFIPVMWDLVNDLTDRGAESASFQIGNSLRELVDLSQYQLKVALTDPDSEKVEANARPIEGTEEGEVNVLHEVEFEGLNKRGFYDLEFRRENEEVVKKLYAVNADPAESDLRRIDTAALPSDFFGQETKMITGDNLIEQSESGATSDIWKWVLLVLAAVLVSEQFLGWWFGRKR